MGLLLLTLLGPVQIRINGQAVAGLNHKATALLAYLAVDAGRAHHREALQSLFWPNAAAAYASNNFRQTLWRLRRALGDQDGGGEEDHQPYLMINRDTVQFNRSSEYRLDVDSFCDSQVQVGWLNESMPVQIEQLKEIVEQYQGNFLHGLYINNGGGLFDDWVSNQREQINQRALLLMHHLTSLLEASGRYQEGQKYARRQLEIDFYNEEACRQLMRLLSLDGQRSAALEFYEQWAARLQEQLGVAPEAQTRAIHAAICDEILSKNALAAHQAVSVTRRQRPQTAVGKAGGEELLEMPFVGRARELDCLAAALERAFSGQGQPVYIRGEAGSGKSALIEEFSRRAMGAYPDLVPVLVHCSGLASSQAPLLPFREIFHLLCGDFSNGLPTALRVGSGLSGEIALRLWGALPATLQAVLQYGPDLAQILSIPPALIAQRLKLLDNGKKPVGITRSPGFPNTSEDGQLGEALPVPEQALPEQMLPEQALSEQRAVFFDQFTRVLRVLSQSHPLLLVVENLSRADEASLAFLFYLSARIPGSRILLAATYRPEEALPRTLKTILAEQKRAFGDIEIDLDSAARKPGEGRAFTRACLEALPAASQPPYFSPAFQERLYQLSGGNALFTVEMLSDLNESGCLARDASGCWQETERLFQHPLFQQPAPGHGAVGKRKTGPAGLQSAFDAQPEKLPSRIEAILEQRANRLPGDLRAILKAASVVGEYFDGELIACMLNLPVEEVLQALLGPLQYLCEQYSPRSPNCFRFRQALFQYYLWGMLHPVERASLREKAALALGVYG